MSAPSIGAVVIGRNEGERLKQCLRSVVPQVGRVVYVDSGSTDDSVAAARDLGADVVVLDASQPFTAARARNVGYRRLRATHAVDYVQFIDGDCELDPTWLPIAIAFLEAHPSGAVACGRRRERHPQRSIYNRLCDIEWNTPVGETRSCGGDALMRTTAFDQCNGYADELIAGEEPDLCFRLRQAGWRIHRLDAEMTLHDAAMTRVSQWWARGKRSGYAAAEASRRRGRFEPDLRRKVASNLLWGLPLAWLLWPLLWCRVAHRRGPLYASHVVLGKVPHLHGQVTYWLNSRRGRQARLIEYK